MGSFLSRLFGRDGYIGETVFIHGQPYVIERRLGQGAFGAVFSASSPDGSPVAVKVNNLRGLPPMKSQKMVQTYLNEVALLERLRRESNHVVYIYDFDFEPSTGQAFIVMELGGANLRAYIDGLRAGGHTIGPALDPFTIKDFWKQMVSIIYTLHRNSIVHMDFKPDNLILFGPILKIADLGTSKRANALGQAGLGTMFFSAPEVMQDRSGLQRFYSPKADIWSLGAILYYMLYGRPPFYSPYAANPPPGFFPPADPALNDVLRQTLVLNPLYRADINSLLYHPYSQF